MVETSRPGPQDIQPPTRKDTRSPVQRLRDMLDSFRERMTDLNNTATGDMQQIVTRGPPEARQAADATLTGVGEVRRRIDSSITPPPTQPKP